MKRMEQERHERENKAREETIEKYKKEEAERAARERKEKEEIIEKFKKQEADRLARERHEREEREREYQRRLHEDLHKAGLNEQQIVAVKEGKALPPPVVQMPARPPPTPSPVQHAHPQYQIQPAGPRPTYTRMSRKHLSLETLRVYGISYEFDREDPEYLLIKRWVPEEEQDILWTHTRQLRETRSPAPQKQLQQQQHQHTIEYVKEYVVEDRHKKKHHRKSDDLQLVIERKHKRGHSHAGSRSPSPWVRWAAGR
ncbi:7d8af07a-a5ec-43d5-8171-8b239201bf8c [Sclerotinia trifoliorum]|uniref:7d8af07a-a5ec-43d5-8171-8b239201bf8c n=1 Tax=Sclerotinia trifoliorum TaxID=28548 RepID=A0A8H2VZE9_9HELO|nr:7d8af07a-a5ec-43d5-8171-8b239201bf8c [Sclerotinia trifoliorum]